MGDRLQYEQFGNNKLWFLYDADGLPAGVRYDDGTAVTYYYYVCNWRRDVVALYSDTALVCKYDYDAWGNVTSVKDADGTSITSSTHIANINPIRYRGYYYDYESGLYYINSRYYDAGIRRFINADNESTVSGTTITDKNLFAYCDDNPITREDVDGECWNIVIGAAVGGVLGGIMTAVESCKETGSVNVKAVLISTAIGAVGGGISASGLGPVAQAIAGGVLGGANNISNQLLISQTSINNIDLIDFSLDVVIGAGSSVGSYYITKSASKSADKVMAKGAYRQVKGQQKLLKGNKAGKAAIKRGTEIFNKGLKKLNKVRCIASVICSGIATAASVVKSVFKHLFRRK